KKFICSSPIVAEACAILEVVFYASSSPLSCSVFSDCKTLTSCLSRPMHWWPCECYSYLGSIRAILDSYDHISVFFVPRRFNGKADWVAKSVRAGTLPDDWKHSLICEDMAYP
ncbi:hypothetical protein LINPERHAP1_LOCUS25215, partial [Linum perenne]